MIERHLGRDAAVFVRMYVLFMIATVTPKLPEMFWLPILVFAVFVMTGLTRLTTNPETCERCRNRCDHESLPPDPVCWE